jgi:NADH-quinone oxidoreductase subunit N
MTVADLQALLPLGIVALTAIIVMLIITFRRSHAITIGLTLIGLVLAFITLSIPGSTQVTPLLMLDGYARFFIGLIFCASAAVTALSYGYLEKQIGAREEFYMLLLLATLGSAVLAASSHFASFFLGLEILSISLYAMIGYPRTRVVSIEASIKYLILAATSAAILLFGMALVYAETGTMEFAPLAIALRQVGSNALVLIGLGMILVGFGFKLALVPFHLWTPDVYEGAPTPVTAFIATVSKGAMFALLLRYFTQIDLRSYGSLYLVFAAIALASMVVGNLLAVLQSNVKRILAFSSIAHLGYLLVAFLASGALAVTAVAFYLTAYFVTTLGAFGVVAVLSSEENDATKMENYHGLFSRHPRLTVVFTAMLLSLGGIPLTAGFVGKFYLVAAGVGSTLWLLVIVLVLTSVIGLFYYLRLVIAMYEQPVEATAPVPALSLASGIVLATLTLLLVWLGVYPAPLIDLIQAMIGKWV